MFAKVELTDEIIRFIKNSETYNESFNEIKELIFTSNMLNLKYSFIEQMKIKIQFQEMKNNTFYKILHNKELNYVEGMLFERLVTKYNGLELMPIEEHLKLIEECCEDIPPKKKSNRRFSFIIERIKQLWKKKETLEKIVLESKYPYSMLVYKLIHQDYFKKTIKKIDNMGVPCNVNPNEITSANEQFLQLLNRFIEFFDNSFYFLHTDSYCYIRIIIETNYESIEKYLLSKNYLGDNDYIDFFQDSIYRIIVSNFIKNVALSKTLKKLLKSEGIAIKLLNDYSLNEILKINDLLSNITLANAKNKFNAIILFDDINKSISQIEQKLKKKKLNKKEILSCKKSILNQNLFKIDLLIEEYKKKKKYLALLK